MEKEVSFLKEIIDMLTSDEHTNSEEIRSEIDSLEQQLSVIEQDWVLTKAFA